MKFKQNHRLLFLDPLVDGEIESKKSKVDIILSPSLYWVKKIKLPLSSVREAKKLLPSIFEESLPQGNYSYSAYKVEDGFMAFAYEDKKILNLLASRDIPISMVTSIRFAQSEFDRVEMPIKINEEEILYPKNGVVVLTPLSWVEHYTPLDITHLQLSKHTITLQQFGHIVDNRSLYKIGFVGLFFIMILAVELFITSQKTVKILDAKDEIFSKYHLPSTMMQNHSTQKKYNTIYKRQTKLREYISYFLALRLQKSQKIKLVEYKENSLRVTIENVLKGKERAILSQLDAKKLNYKTSFKNGTMRVEVGV